MNENSLIYKKKSFFYNSLIIEQHKEEIKKYENKIKLYLILKNIVIIIKKGMLKMNIVNRIKLKSYPELQKMNFDEETLIKIISNKNFKE